MADVRCPMCGKINPDDLDICQYCQARLKPLSLSMQDGEVPSGSAGTPPQSADESDNQRSLDEWLNFLRDSGEGTSSPSEFEESAPDWLEEGQDLEDLSAQSLPMDEEPSDWLSGLREESDEVSLSAAEAADQPEQDELAFPEISPEEDIPDWLKEIGSGAIPGSPTPAEEPPIPDVEPAAPGAEEQPDWLQKIRARQKDEAESEEEIRLEQPFLSDLEQPGETEMAESSVFGMESASEEEIPRWLEELRGEGVSGAEPGGAPSPLEESELEEAQPQEEPEGLEAPPPGVTPIAEELPPEEAPVPSGAPAEEEIPEWMAGVVAGGEMASAAEADLDRLPEWLADLEKASALDREAIIPFGEEEPELTFDWLQAQIRGDEDVLQVQAAKAETPVLEPETGPVSPFVGDLSEFLEDAELSAGEVEVEAVQKPGEDLAPADLPAWLEAMRPLEVAGLAGADEADAVVETSGPLAGLRGVLPAEPEFARLSKPTVYALRLQVSENQQAHANLLEELVQAEGASKPIPARPAITSQYLFRLIIFIILAGLIGWAVFTTSRTLSLPAVSNETFEVSKLIDSLPDNPLILLAVDYEPALAGEMEATSSSVVDHMMLKGAYFVLVSTSPTGPALGEHLIANVSNRSGHVYTGIEQYANLGYIPGGPSGLAAFAQTPQKIVPYALDPETTPVWSRPPLQSVQRLSDFDLVAIVTDDPERARYWIEQVRPTLAATPLVMLVSAQAEPLVRPYYQAAPRQVQGIIAGLAGGGSYENAHPNLVAGNGLARRYWDAYSFSLLAASLIIVVGAFYSLVVNLAVSRKQAEAEKKP